MNIFVTGFQTNLSNPILYKILGEFNVENCHRAVYHPQNVKVPPFTKQTLYQHKNLFYKGPDPDDLNQTKPIDERILKELLECEVDLLKNMDRMSRSFYFSKPEFKDYNFRKIYYIRHVRYWYNVLEENNINLAIFQNIPHDVFDFIIFHICQLKKIPTICFMQTHIPDTTLFFDNFEEPHVDLKDKHNTLRIDLKDIPESEIQLGKRFIDHIKKQLKDPIPFYRKVKKKHSKLLSFLSEVYGSFIKILKNGSSRKIKSEIIQVKCVIKNYLLYLKNKITPTYLKYRKEIKRRSKKDKQLYKYYEKLTIEPDLSKDYIYIPLHYQPEASTSPLAGIFAYQQLLIQMLSYFLPENYYLYVKEHPASTALFRDKKFYEEISLSNVHLISRSFDTYKLIENSIAVATCTGRAGWEALFRGKPVLLFGTVYYQYANGVFRIHNLEDCQKALNQILKNNVKPTLKDMKIFLKALELTSIEGYNFPFFESSLSEDQNTENFSKAIIDKIRLILHKSRN